MIYILDSIFQVFLKIEDLAFWGESRTKIGASKMDKWLESEMSTSHSTARSFPHC